MHKLVAWLSENFVPVWKAVSILFTGAFGILGLVKNFKKKILDPETDVTTEKITTWGWISLIGIILSSTFGIAAQLMETHKNELDAEETRKSQTPLEEPKLDIAFSISCDGNVWYRDICDRETAPRPFSAAPELGKFGELTVTLFFFRDAKNADACLKSACTDDLTLQFSGTSTASSRHPGGADNVWLRVVGSNMQQAKRRMPVGGIKSALEIRDAVTIITMSVGESPLVPVTLNSINLVLKDGSAFRAHSAIASSVLWGRGLSEVRLVEY